MIQYSKRGGVLMERKKQKVLIGTLVVMMCLGWGLFFSTLIEESKWDTIMVDNGRALKMKGEFSNETSILISNDMVFVTEKTSEEHSHINEWTQDENDD